MSDWLYLLDTNIVSDVVNHPRGVVRRQIDIVGAQTVCTSIIVACELQFGAVKKHSTRLLAQLKVVLDELPVVPFQDDVPVHYARIRADLENAGRPIGSNDYFIAAHAMSLGLILVTHNVKEFGRIPGLRVEDWLE